MKVILKQPGLKAETVELDTIGLADLQHYCEGRVECPYVPELSEAGVTMWANEEGIIQRMPINLIIDHVDFFQPMPIVGPVLFTGSDGDGGTIGLTDAQIEKVKRFSIEQQPTPRKLVKLFGH